MWRRSSRRARGSKRRKRRRSVRGEARPTIASVNTSLFELFKIGIGPSSSHTVGPMRAAFRFVRELEAAGALSPQPAKLTGDPMEKTARVTVDLYGSLALTGMGHGTDRAVLLGLMGEAPDAVDPATVDEKIADVRATGGREVGGDSELAYGERGDLRFRRDEMHLQAAGWGIDGVDEGVSAGI